MTPGAHAKCDCRETARAGRCQVCGDCSITTHLCLTCLGAWLNSEEAVAMPLYTDHRPALHAWITLVRADIDQQLASTCETAAAKP